jgi:hypothetical protein
MNKRASPDVVFFVFLVVILSGFTLFTFISNSNQVSGNVVDARYLDSIYVRENLAEFYINQIMNEVIDGLDVEGKDIKKVSDEEIKSLFIEKFNNKIGSYKTNEAFSYFDVPGDLAGENSVSIEGDEIVLNMIFKKESNFGDKIKVNYLSKNRFVKSFR